MESGVGLQDFSRSQYGVVQQIGPGCFAVSEPDRALLLIRGSHLFLQGAGGFFLMPMMEMGNACLPRCREQAPADVGAKRRPFTGLEAHRRAIARQGQSKDLLRAL